MRRLDWILQDWRYRVVEPHIAPGCRILDIGGFDGSFLKRIQSRIVEGVCIDPLIEERKEGKLLFIKSRVVKELPFADHCFDVVTMIGVYEHLGFRRELITQEVFRVLKKPGLALLTVPSSAVDEILKVLIRMRLVDGMSLAEHEHFRSSETRTIFEGCGFKLKRWSKFQLGLNNLFIFEK
jgi:SAM-dependent methyltransferase